MIKKCEVCTKEFYAKPSHVAKGKGRFCNKICFDNWQRLQPKGEQHHRYNSTKSNCPICNKIVIESPSRRKDGRGKYCSKDCYSKGMSIQRIGIKLSDETRIKLSKQRIGKLNPAYKNGSSRKMIRYQGTFTRLVKQKVYEKYGRICQSCGETKGIIHIHHIDDNPLNSVIENLIPLCIVCHAKKRKGLIYH